MVKNIFHKMMAYVTTVQKNKKHQSKNFFKALWWIFKTQLVSI